MISGNQYARCTTNPMRPERVRTVPKPVVGEAPRERTLNLGHVSRRMESVPTNGCGKQSDTGATRPPLGREAGSSEILEVFLEAADSRFADRPSSRRALDSFAVPRVAGLAGQRFRVSAAATQPRSNFPQHSRIH